MTDPETPTAADVLAGKVEHPVQFVGLVTLGFPIDVYGCTLCGALVVDQELHRASHDRHNAVHAEIERLARKHVPAPTYGGDR